ncbi:MAG TPA: LptF/LptG family permease [Humisphaera sp.]|nr:LptF/LptG family permease [Humisphaera sp.]
MLSRTLFAYIFKDLFRIFMMTSGALAGIMSFGGLLRPLTREGLDAGQVGRMLTYFTPAMTTYSFPVAALFATAVVYGRLSADNELTAARSSGISLISLTVAGPALVLGLIVAIVSLMFLCFIVPASTYKVEQVIYSNIAKFIANRVERNHEVPFSDSGAIIYGQSAYLPPQDKLPRGRQRVVIYSPTIVKVDRPRPQERDYRVPRDFYTGSRAIIDIQKMRGDEDEVQMTMTLEGGFKFPRVYEGAVEAGIEQTSYGPVIMPSPIKPDVKFMDVWRLKHLYNHIADSEKVRKVLNEFRLNGQREKFFEEVSNQLNSPQHEARFNFETGEHYVLKWDGPGPVGAQVKELIAPLPEYARTQAGTTRATGIMATPRPVLFQKFDASGATLTMHAASMRMFARPRTEADQLDVTLELTDCFDGTLLRSQPFVLSFNVPMSDAVKSMADQSLEYFESKAAVGLGDQRNLMLVKTEMYNAIIAESNGRASFAISCLILVMAGSALGMMFKSGNFLTAFAVSFVPALLSITLIIAGQRVASHLPLHFNPANNAPLQTGLFLIWIGNFVNLALAGTLLWRLGRK